MYNRWFVQFVPEAYRTTRVQTTRDVEATLRETNNLADIGVALLKAKPAALKNNPALRRQVWRLLNDIGPQTLLGEGRVYGGGLHKLEPKELGRVPAAAIAELLPDSARPRVQQQGELFEAARA